MTVSQRVISFVSQVAEVLGWKAANARTVRGPCTLYEFVLGSSNLKYAVFVWVKIWEGGDFQVVFDTPGNLLIITDPRELRGAYLHIKRFKRQQKRNRLLPH